MHTPPMLLQSLAMFTIIHARLDHMNLKSMQLSPLVRQRRAAIYIMLSRQTFAPAIFSCAG
jgi:hypothetical protein